ncbi:MAG: hypothetical protein KAY65_03320 [Planctomycetes bacterium]|nr:hypothetical protein [Planctomycetota bacterium]
MEASKCPIGMLWLILSVPVYWVAGDRIDGLEDRPTKQGSLLKEFYPPIHIRPPPLVHRSFKSLLFY